MKTGIIVAMDKELNLVLEQLHDHRTTTVNGTVYHTGTIAGRPVTVLKCGIGKVNAAVSALTLIDNFHVNLVINTGVAGGTGQGARVGDVVIADTVAYHDVWCGPGTVPGQAAGCPDLFESPLDADTLARHLPGVKHGMIASGDIFVSRPDDLQRILAVRPHAIAVDMESGAIAQVCHLKNVPFLCIRVVSDTPGQHHDNAAQYQTFWEDAPLSTFKVLDSLMTLI